MRAPLVVPACYASPMAAWTKAMALELTDSDEMRAAWNANPREGEGQCVVLVLDANDTLADVVQALLRAGRILPDLPNATHERSAVA